MCALFQSSDIMSEGVSLIIWPTTANYSLISLWFYVLCQKLRKCYNGISILKRAYLHNHWFESYELNSIRKPRRSTLLSLCNAKWYFHTVKHHTATNPKLPNIAMLSKPTVYSCAVVNARSWCWQLSPWLIQSSEAPGFENQHNHNCTWCAWAME